MRIVMLIAAIVSLYICIGTITLIINQSLNRSMYKRMHDPCISEDMSEFFKYYIKFTESAGFEIVCVLFWPRFIFLILNLYYKFIKVIGGNK